MPSLYEILGVERDATAKAIHAAYRKKAKTAHPDVGGKRQEFELLQLAHDTLTNDALRAHYDATGQIKAKEIDQGRSQVIQMIAALMEHVITESMQRGIEVTQFDMIGALTMALGKQNEHMASQVAGFEKKLKTYNKILKRFKRKKNKTEDSDNMLESVVIGIVSGIEQNVRTLKSQKSIVDEALQIVKDHTYERDKIETATGPSVFSLVMGFP